MNTISTSAKKEKVRKVKEEAKIKAAADKQYSTAVFDLQQNIYLPVSAKHTILQTEVRIKDITISLCTTSVLQWVPVFCPTRGRQGEGQRKWSPIS